MEIDGSFLKKLTASSLWIWTFLNGEEAESAIDRIWRREAVGQRVRTRAKVEEDFAKILEQPVSKATILIYIRAHTQTHKSVNTQNRGFIMMG